MDGPDLGGFLGLWRMERVIDDRRAGEILRLSGRAELSKAGDGRLCYCETGQLDLAGGQKLQAVRRYFWRAEGGTIRVDFEDGRYFHSFDPAAADPDAAHWCDPDQYDVRYDFARWPRWKSVWQVLGPRKDYTMTTWYRRSQDGSA
ncbi:trigger factor [Pseudoruegeria sp. M32A2M]|nr:trigger factor [Pseudoruegeria sp. M32A2M]